MGVFEMSSFEHGTQAAAMAVAEATGKGAYTFFKAMGGNTGSSLCENDKLDLALGILKKAKELGVSIHLPKDSVIADGFSNEANFKTANSNEIP